MSAAEIAKQVFNKKSNSEKKFLKSLLNKEDTDENLGAIIDWDNNKLNKTLRADTINELKNLLLN